MKTAFALLVFVAASILKADDFASRFAGVMIDDETEAKLGAFPYDRAVLAKAVDTCADAGAQAVVLKFFIDLPKSAPGDAALRDAIKRIPVALQARLESSEGTRRQIPEKFRLSHQSATAVRGDLGWFPLPSLMDFAAAVGFVDFDSPTIPLVEEYQGAAYRSLILCCLEFAVNAQARIEPNRIYIGRGFLPVSATNSFQADVSQLEPLKIISFARLLAGNVGKAELEKRVIIIGLDSARSPGLVTERGNMKVHRFFIQCLAASYRALQANQALEPTAPRGGRGSP